MWHDSEVARPLIGRIVIGRSGQSDFSLSGFPNRIDAELNDVLRRVVDRLAVEVDRIRSGGQNGASG